MFSSYKDTKYRAEFISKAMDIRQIQIQIRLFDIILQN